MKGFFRIEARGGFRIEARGRENKQTTRLEQYAQADKDRGESHFGGRRAAGLRIKLGAQKEPSLHEVEPRRGFMMVTMSSMT